MTMLERMARATWGKTPKCDLQGSSEGPCSLGDECYCWTAALKNARAALQAMREPTEAMVLAAYRAFDAFGPDAVLGPHETLAIWHAMIDAALEEGTKG
jgi:hypothetical protein